MMSSMWKREKMRIMMKKRRCNWQRKERSLRNRLMTRKEKKMRNGRQIQSKANNNLKNNK